MSRKQEEETEEQDSSYEDDSREQGDSEESGEIIQFGEELGEQGEQEESGEIIQFGEELGEQGDSEESGEIIQFGEGEVIEQREEQEEDLEEEAEAYPSQFDADNFSQFIGERTAPLLQINDTLEQIPDTSLEGTAETAPTTTTTENQPGLYATSNTAVIGEPDYSGSRKYEHLREEEQKSRTMREHGVLGAIDETDIHQRRAEQSQTGWGSELKDLQQQSSKYQEVMQTRQEQETTRLPFERRKMKERRL